jgi:hypothetical protein
VRTAPRTRANIIGDLAVLDADGGNQRQLIGVNEIGVSHRAVGALSITRDDVAILRIRGGVQAVNYSIRITQKS